MSAMNSDQLHRSTLGIYTSLIDQFNPSLQKLVSLGSSYVQAFQALAVTSEAYFNAISKIGEQALHTMSSRSIGDVLIQISENQRRLTMDLEGVFRWFHNEVLQEMDNNIRLDKDYISGSRRRYEMEVRSQATALEKQLRRGHNQNGSEYVQFLMDSHSEALNEEERRYRFLAEKHCGLAQTIVQLMNKTEGALQQRTDTWREEVNATRQHEHRGRSAMDDMMGMREEERGRGREREEQPLGRVPSRAPSPQGSCSNSSSVAVSLGGEGAGRPMRALVVHQPGSNSTLLPFSKGEMVSVLVPQARNGWLYGRAESSSRQGWFPASYVEPVEDVRPASSSNSTLRSSGSMSNLLDQSGGNSYGGGQPPAPPPPPSSVSSNKQSERPPITPTPDRRAESNNKRSEHHGSCQDLFPKGTNPFATVKLKPTMTNDRSAPKIYR